MYIVYVKRKIKSKKLRIEGKEYKSNFFDKPEENAELIIGKNRNGPVGVANLIFQKACTKFIDAGGIPVEIVYDESNIPARESTLSGLPSNLMKSLPLFVSKREIISTLLVIVVLFLSSLSYEFYKYKKLTIYSLHVTTVKVVNSYIKKDKNYRVLKLKSSDITFYTTYKKPLHVNRGDTLKVILYTKNINFYSYLKGFYTPLKSLHVKRKAEKNSIVEFVQNQHTSLVAKEIYSAYFLRCQFQKS